MKDKSRSSITQDNRRQGETRGERGREKTGQHDMRRDTTRQDTIWQDKTRRGEGRQDTTWRDKTKQDKTRQAEPRRDEPSTMSRTRTTQGRQGEPRHGKTISPPWTGPGQTDRSGDTASRQKLQEKEKGKCIYCSLRLFVLYIYNTIHIYIIELYSPMIRLIRNRFKTI